MIPKIIHYCWFGGKPLGELEQKCIDSWKKYCPDYEIIEWNEKNFDINSNSYVKEAYEAKKWAFVSDYVRLYALVNHGGIYMDTDVELIKGIDLLLENTAFSGFEDDIHIPTAIMGSVPHGEWLEYLLSYYYERHFIRDDGTFDTKTNVITITEMTMARYDVKLNNTFQKIDDVMTLYPSDFFCPKSYETMEIVLTQNTVCIHHFNASWYSSIEKTLYRKKAKYVEKNGAELGGKKFQKWCKRNRVYIYMRRHGFKKTIIKVYEKLLRN